MDEGKGNTGRRRWPVPTVDVARGEWKPVLLSGGFFFCVLFAIMMLRPVREAMGVERGMDSMRSLFYWTAGVSLVVALLFGGLVSRVDRRRFIPIGFRVVMLCLVVFAVARGVMGDDVKRYAGAAFYVWFSVFNMFVTSVFWAYMADIWRLDQAKRLYPVIGVGGTFGAFLGPMLAGKFGKHFDAQAPILVLLISIVVFECAARCMMALDRQPMQGEQIERPAHAVGGTMLDGLKMVAGSPYLLCVALNAAFIAVSATLVYFASARLVVDRSREMGERLVLFAQLDIAKQLATLVLQIFVTKKLLRTIGVGGTLGVLPILTVAGFAVVQMTEGESDLVIWSVFAVFQGLHSATRYAVMRPARETLFSVLSEGEKYKAKTVVDMFVYRAGDVAGARIEQMLVGAAGVTLGSMVMLTAPMAGIWVILALGLGVMQRKRADSGKPSSLERADKGATNDETDTA
ncbi:MAG: NTP/NDP exchange transporter [Phycisphaerales bacterium JB058]